MCLKDEGGVLVYMTESVDVQKIKKSPYFGDDILFEEMFWQW